MKAPGEAFARGLALAAVREMAEETGLLLGTRRDDAPAVPGEIWAAFAKARVHPDLAQIHLIARAITPPRRPKRYDTRFFTADANAVAYKIEGIVGPDFELVELTWVPIEEATHLDMPTITGVVLEETCCPRRGRHGPRACGAVLFHDRAAVLPGSCCKCSKIREFLDICRATARFRANQRLDSSVARENPWPKPSV